MSDTRQQSDCAQARQTLATICAIATEAGWDGVNNSKILAEFLRSELDELWAARKKLEQPNAAEEALNAIAKLCGCERWEYPGQVVRDVEQRLAYHEVGEALARGAADMANTAEHGRTFGASGIVTMTKAEYAQQARLVHELQSANVELRKENEEARAALNNERATVREAAIREAAAECAKVANESDAKAGKARVGLEFADRDHFESMGIGAELCVSRLRALLPPTPSSKGGSGDG